MCYNLQSGNLYKVMERWCLIMRERYTQLQHTVFQLPVLVLPIWQDESKKRKWRLKAQGRHEIPQGHYLGYPMIKGQVGVSILTHLISKEGKNS